MKTALYYFSGTGNTLSVARRLARELGDTDIIPIARTLNVGIDDDTDAIGILSPVYCMDLPWTVRQFITTLPRFRDKYYFFIFTCGTMPGGIVNRAVDIFDLKKMKTSAAYVIPMPGNVMTMYDEWERERQLELFRKAGEKIKYIAEVVKNRKDDVLEKQGRFRYMLSRILSWLSKRVLFGKFDKKFWVDDKCNNCMLCGRVCTTGNIIMAYGKPTWQNGKCERCLACLNWCPEHAIQYGKKTAVRGRYTHPDIDIEDMLDSFPKKFENEKRYV
ncbi:MAG: EFR1 family ferrodoxin [Elusimicrobia bacterium]|nr:EFR1 family ferrodoxin [Elusimicrobiota bacterium]